MMMNKEKQMNMTAESFKLFIALANDADNWNGQPILDITKEQRGNLSQLKKLQLLTTFKDEGCDFVIFSDAGKKLALENNIKL